METKFVCLSAACGGEPVEVPYAGPYCCPRCGSAELSMPSVLGSGPRAWLIGLICLGIGLVLVVLAWLLRPPLHRIDGVVGAVEFGEFRASAERPIRLTNSGVLPLRLVLDFVGGQAGGGAVADGSGGAGPGVKWLSATLPKRVVEPGETVELVVRIDHREGEPAAEYAGSVVVSREGDEGEKGGEEVIEMFRIPVTASALAEARPTVAAEYVLSLHGAQLYSGAGGDALSVVESGEVDKAGKPLPLEVPFLSALRIDQEKLAAAPRDGYVPLKGERGDWIARDKCVEYQNALSMKYEPYDEDLRNRAVFFKDEKASQERLKEILTAPSIDRIERVTKLEETLKKPAGEWASNRDASLVVAREPRLSQNTQKDPIYIPILKFEQVESGEQEVNLLQLIAGVRGQDESGKSIEAKYPDIDVVWVVDTSGTMGPYIDGVKEAMRRVAVELKDKPYAEHLKFGAVGYRDLVGKAPGIGYATKAFTDGKLVTPEVFVDEVIGKIEANEVTEDDWEEDVFSGLKVAMGTQWTSDLSIRILVLVGDAPGNSVAKGNSANVAPVDLEPWLRESRRLLIPLYILNPGGEDYHDEGIRQFAELAGLTNPESKRWTIKSGKGFVEEMAKNFGDVVIGGLENGFKKPPDAPVEEAEEGGLSEHFREPFRRGYVEWEAAIHAKPVTDEVKVWSADRDLERPAVDAMYPTVMLRREQLRSLVDQLQSIVDTFERLGDEQEPGDFFTALRSASAGGVRDPQGATLEEIVIDPFIRSLPYKSEILALTPGAFREEYQGDPGKIAALQEKVKGRLRKLQVYLDEAVDHWIGPSDTPDEQLIFVPLSYMP